MNSISSRSLDVPHKPEIFTLPNGLTIIVEEDHTAPIATVQAWCATGSIHEGAHLGAGVSHILEHMILFKGTINRPPGAIVEEVGRQGGSINAYTTYNRTVYYVDLPSAGVADAIDILADAMMNATFPISEYTKEQEVIRREIAMRADNPDVVLGELLYRTAFRVSAIREPLGGHLNIFDKLTREEVMAYYKERYVPNNICFIVVGAVSSEKIREQLSFLFKKYPYRALAPVVLKEEPPQLTKRVARETFSINKSLWSMAWKVPKYLHPDTQALEVLASILGSGKSSLLQQELREKKELVYTIGAGLNLEAGLIYIGATVDPTKRTRVGNEILHQIDLLKKRGVTAIEVERAKNLLISSHFRSLENIHVRASEYGASWLETGDPCYREDYFAALARVTFKEVNRVAKEYLVKDKLTLVSLDPKSIDEPISKKNSAVANKEEARNKAVKGTRSGVKKFTLPNGLRLLIHEDHRLPLISMTALFRGGVMAEDEKTNGLTHLLASTITKGTCSKSAEEIAQTLEQAGGTLSARTGNDSFGLYLNVMKPDFKLGLTLLADVLTEPIFLEIEVAREKKNQCTAIACEDDDVQKFSYKLLQKKLFGTHPYARRALGTKEMVSAFTPEIVRAMYQQFVVGRNGVISIFGDVKTEEVLAVATKAFANLPSGALALQIVPSPTPLTRSLQDQAIQEREQAIVMKGFLGASIKSPDRPALELLSTACNDMNSRFFKELRGKKSLVYFVNNWNVMQLARRNFVFYLGADPKKRTLAQEELNHEIDHLVQNGLTQKELDHAKKRVLNNEAFYHQSNANFGNQVAFEELMGLGFEHYQHRADEINRVTLEEMNRIIKKYLGVPGSVEVVVGPK